MSSNWRGNYSSVSKAVGAVVTGGQIGEEGGTVPYGYKMEVLVSQNNSSNKVYGVGLGEKAHSAKKANVGCIGKVSISSSPIRSDVNDGPSGGTSGNVSKSKFKEGKKTLVKGSKINEICRSCL
ncbi:hypothetical protein QYF36_018740 [Acer negundo]|nr:hypothetical protein QYF36_018740 [Acer negundo]